MLYSPQCAAVTSCSARRACSPVGQSTEYASWGQATICQIRPIGHVRCAVYSVSAGVGRVSHACWDGRFDSARFGMHTTGFRKPPRSGAIHGETTTDGTYDDFHGLPRLRIPSLSSGSRRKTRLLFTLRGRTRVRLCLPAIYVLDLPIR